MPKLNDRMNNKSAMINLTDAAIEVIKAKLAKRENKNAFLRLGVKGSGCSGFTYVIEFDDKKQRENDVLFSFDEHNVQILIDKKSLQYLDGLTLDYKKTIMKEGFEITNPMEAEKCGCGKSFNIKK